MSCQLKYSIRSQLRTCFYSLVDILYVTRAPLHSRLVPAANSAPFFPWPRLQLQSRMARQRPPSTTYNAQKFFCWVNGGLFSPLLSPHPRAGSQPSVLQEREDLHPAGPIQRRTPEANLLSRTHIQSGQTPIRVRPIMPHPLIPFQRVQAPSSPSRYGIVPATQPPTPSALVLPISPRSSLSLIYRWRTHLLSVVRHMCPHHAHARPCRTPINSLLLACWISSLRHIRRTRVQRWRSSSTKQSHSRRITR